jgi:hypothetical protein
MLKRQIRAFSRRLNLQAARRLEADPRARAAARRALDLLYPPQALDGAGSPQWQGLSADGWSRVRFIAEPLCDGCVAFFIAEHSGTTNRHQA